MKFEIGDIIEVSITLDVDIPEEELEKNVIDIDNYEKPIYKFPNNRFQKGFG